jgi:hypothetical protein
VSVHGKPWELHDPEADRTELNDLAARVPSRVKELAAQWEKRVNVKKCPRRQTFDQTARRRAGAGVPPPLR